MSEDEKKAKELAEKVEGAFPKEDANQTQVTQSDPTNEKGTPLWGKEQKDKDKKTAEEGRIKPSQADILIYQARELHLMRLEMEAFLNKVFSMIQKPVATPAAQNQVAAPAPATQGPKTEKLMQLENALVEWTNCNPVLIEINTTESTMFYVVRFKQFLGSDNFAKISSACRALGGQYVSEGKQSHFKCS